MCSFVTLRPIRRRAGPVRNDVLSRLPVQRRPSRQQPAPLDGPYNPPGVLAAPVPFPRGAQADRGEHVVAAAEAAVSAQSRRIGSALSYCGPGSGNLSVTNTNAILNAQ